MKRDRRRGRRGGDQFFGVRRTVLWTAAAMSLAAGAAMGMVWLNVQFTTTSLRHERARNEHEKLLSDLNANRLRLLNRVRLSDLDPQARERLGLTEPSVDAMHLVRFHPSLDGENPATAGLIDRIVPPAGAGTDWMAVPEARTGRGSPARVRP